MSGSDTMLAAVYHGPRDLRVEAVPRPVAGAGELLLRVEEASICGTDLRVYNGQHRLFPPGTVRIPGHEVVGVIAEVGPGVDGYTSGHRVFVAPNMGCGDCRQCVSGANNLCPDYQAVGLTMDGAGYGMGTRSSRYAMLVDDGVVKKLNVEAPGAFEVSSAEAMLREV